MATTDYNKFKELSPTSTNDSGATVDKAQPVLIKGESLVQDGFEDGDYTNDPSWTASQDGDTSVQSTVVKNGSNALESAADGSGNINNIETSQSIDASSTVTFSGWFQITGTSSNAQYSIGDTGSSDSINIEFSDGDISYNTYDSSGNSLSSGTLVSSFTTSSWYRFEMIVDSSSSTADFNVYDSTDSLVGSASNIDTSGSSSFSKVNISHGYTFSNESLYADDVSYNYISESATGTGDIVVDDSNITSQSDIAFYDMDGNTLPYELENGDTAITASGLSEPLVGWVYNPDGWTRDDSAQAQLVYGDSPTSSEEDVTGTWDNTGQNAEMVQHLEESSSPFLDSTANNNDSVSTTGTTQDISEFDGGRRFNGTDDVIDFPDIDFTQNHTAIVWFNSDEFNNRFHNVLGKRDPSTGDQEMELHVDTDTSPPTLRYRIPGSTNYEPEWQGPSTGTWYQTVGTFNGSAVELFVDGASKDTDSAGSTTRVSVNTEMGRLNSGLERYWDGLIDEFRVYSDVKNSSWIQADYDASPKAGQVFFSQSAAESTVQTIEETFNQDVSIKDEDRTKGFSQTVILENRNIPEQFSQDVAIAEKDLTKTLDTDVSVLDQDVTKTFTQDVTLFDRDAEKTFSQDVSLKLEDETATFSQDVIVSAGNQESFSQDVSIKDLDREKQFSQDLILENANIPEQFNQDVNIADLDVEQTFSQDLLVANLDQEATFSQDIAVSDRMTETFDNSVVIAKQPAPNTRNPLTVKNLAPTETFVQVLKPSNTYLKVKDVK